MYPEYNTTQKHPYIPVEAFLYHPINKNGSQHHQKQLKSIEDLENDDYRIVNASKQIKRYLYEGNTEFTKFEEEELQKFQAYLDRKKIKIDPRWSKSWRLRFLQSVDYDAKRFVEDMGEFIKYQDVNKQLIFTSSIEKHLKNGVFYIAGRDSRFRPIVVFDVPKILSNKLTEQEVYNCQKYLFEFILRYMLIPGQVQNWISITDVGNQGVMSMAGPMKASINFLQETFRARMFIGYIVRPSSTTSFMWAIAQNFLSEDTKRKINFIKDKPMADLLTYCNSSQLQEKFGGTLKNMVQGEFWPPRLHSNNYKSQQVVNMMTKQQYKQLYREEKLSDTKVYENFTIEKVRRENTNFKWLEEKDGVVRKELEQMKQPEIESLQKLHRLIGKQTMGKTKSYQDMFG